MEYGERFHDLHSLTNALYINQVLSDFFRVNPSIIASWLETLVETPKFLKPPNLKSTVNNSEETKNNNLIALVIKHESGFILKVTLNFKKAYLKQWLG